MKTARLMITTKCARGCSYCVNAYNNGKFIKDAVLISHKDLYKLKGLDEIAITGGDVLYDKNTANLTHHICCELKKITPDTKLWLYLSSYDTWLNAILDEVDGITYTLHSNPTSKDIEDLKAIERTLMLKRFKGTKRLALSNDLTSITHPIELASKLWDNIRIKYWFPGDACKVPEDTLFLLHN